MTSKLARWATTDNIIDAVTTLAAALGVLFVTLAGIVLSYNALWELARVSSAVAPGLTWLWPLTLDALAVVASLNVLWAETRHERDRYAWALVIAFTLLSVVFNAIHAGLAELPLLHPLAPALVAGFVGILPPVAAAFALHLLVRLLRRVLLRVSLIAGIDALSARRTELAAAIERQRAEAAADLDKRRIEAAAETERLTRQVEALRARAEALKTEVQPRKVQANRRNVQELNEARAARVGQRRADLLALLPRQLSQAEMARILGVDVKTIKRDLVALNGAARAAGNE